MRRLAFAGPVALALVLTPLALGCEQNDAKTALSYTADAKRSYEDALEEFNAHNWIEAQNLMREVKRKYSYSKYARLAELRIADADFEQEKYPEAVREYRQFVHDHRSDKEEVSYARSRIAEAQYKQIAESFLLPTGDERDQATVLEAYQELKRYVHDYPDGKDSTRMRDLLADVTARLVRHELYVARFYLQKDNYEAAVVRIEYALRNFSSVRTSLVSPHPEGHPSEGPSGAHDPESKSESKNDLKNDSKGSKDIDATEHDSKASKSVSSSSGLVDSGLEAEALLLLGETYLKMHRYEEAREAFQEIIQDYPKSGIVIQAGNYLNFMKQRGV